MNMSIILPRERLQQGASCSCKLCFMKNTLGLAVAALAISTAAAVMSADGPPAWAYGVPAAGAPAANPPAAAAAPPDTSPKHLPGSSGEFTPAQIRDGFGPADWFPGDHPAMPEVVSHGRKPDVRACGLCHYPNGKGRPENAG